MQTCSLHERILANTNACIYATAHACMHGYLHTRVRMRMRMHAYVPACVRICERPMLMPYLFACMRGSCMLILRLRICVHAYPRAHMYACGYVCCAHACISAYAHAHARMRTNAHECARMRTNAHACCLYAYEHTYLHVCMLIRIRVQACRIRLARMLLSMGVRRTQEHHACMAACMTAYIQAYRHTGMHAFTCACAYISVVAWQATAECSQAHAQPPYIAQSPTACTASN